MAHTAAYDGKTPHIAPSVFLAEGSVVVGEVEIGERSSLWFGTVVRGDVNHVRIGARTNVQDLSVVHFPAAETDAPAGALVRVRVTRAGGSSLSGALA